MIELHPEFFKKNGQEFVLLTSEEFIQIQQLLDNLNNKNQSSGLNKIQIMQQDSVNNWKIAINKIGKKDKIEQQEKIQKLFDSWDNLDEEQEQKEILDIIQSMEDMSI